MTMQQTKVYIALNKLEQATVRTIAKNAQMDRAEVYRAIPKLQKLGLIKKFITTPTAFRAVPLSEGLSILLQRDAEKHKKNQKKAENFLRNVNHIEKPSPVDNQYILTSGFKAEEREFLRNTNELQNSTDGILEWNEFLYVFKTYFKEYKKVLERGVKIRRIIRKPEGEKIPQLIQNLMKKGSFEIKLSFSVPKANIDIFDKKLVSIITVPDSGMKEMEALRSSNPGILELLQDYFDMKWQSATTLACETKPANEKHNLKRFSRRIEHKEKEMKPTSTFIS
jgi:sugar-specific transcriptional regulator TrmB